MFPFDDFNMMWFLCPFSVIHISASYSVSHTKHLATNRKMCRGMPSFGHQYGNSLSSSGTNSDISNNHKFFDCHNFWCWLSFSTNRPHTNFVNQNKEIKSIATHEYKPEIVACKMATSFWSQCSKCQTIVVWSSNRKPNQTVHAPHARVVTHHDTVS